jgi:streptogramin lyase
MKSAIPLACLVLATSARAGTITLVYAASVYSDAKDGALSAPEGVACTPEGGLVVADTGNGRLLRLAFKDGAFSPAVEWKFPELGHPVRLQIDAHGDVFSLDERTRRIARLSPEGQFRSFLDLKGAAPVSFRVDAAGTLYLLDVSAGQVVVVDASGNVARQLPLPKGSFTDVAVGAQGTIYAVDAVAATVVAAEKSAKAFSPFSPLLREYASFPTSIAITDRGLLLVVDQHGNGLVVLGPDGSFLGRQLSIGWSDGFLYYPGQLCLDAKGDAFIADRGNNRLQAFAGAK